MRTKTHDFYCSVAVCDFDIVCLAETWLSDDISNDELFPSSYSVLRQDRQFDTNDKKRGGGVLMGYKSALSVSRLNVEYITTAIPAVDILGCSIHTGFNTSFVYVIYIPPDLNNIDFEHFLTLLEEACNSHQGYVLVVGDFNVPHFSVSTSDARKQLLENFISFTNLNQYNSIVNNRGRLLDLVLSNKDNICVEHEVMALLSEDPYHPSISFVFEFGETLPSNLPANNRAVMYNFKKANYIGLYNSFLSVDWSFILDHTDADIACEHFYAELFHIIDMYVPKKHHNSHQYPVWFTKGHINDIKLKYRYRLEYKKSRSVSDLNNYKNLRKKVKTNTTQLYNNYLHTVQNSIMNDPKQFWQYVRSKRSNTGIPSTVRGPTGDLLTDSASIVDGFREFFQSVYLPNSNDQTYDSPANSRLITVTSFSESDVFWALRRQKNSFTTGNDGLPSFILRDCAGVFAKPLCYLFNLALQTSTFPKCWKIAKLCPVFKNGDVHLIENYRPIAIIDNFAKVFEMCLYSYIYSQIKSQLSIAQHGFVSKRSTVTNLTVFTECVSECLDKNTQCDAIFTDLSKAFDRIDHSILVQKLDRIGFAPSLITFFKTYLLSRQQYVVYRGHRSDVISPSSGVPQGTNLGPLLFLIFMDDVCDVLDCDKLLFADDLKIYCAVHSISDCLYLQHQLELLESWCQVNGLQMNPNKCRVVSFTRKLIPVTYTYIFSGVDLGRATSVTDLGVTFDSRLSFSDHIINSTKAALRTLGFIVRTTKPFFYTESILPLYYSFVRSKLEYASVVWSPYYFRYLHLLEGVQRRFLKYLYFKLSGLYPPQGCSHDYLLSTFSVDPLELRRNQADIKFLFHLLHNNIDAPQLLSRINFLVPRHSARSSDAFYCSTARTNVMLRSPINRLCTSFNLICDESSDINYSSLPSLLSKCATRFRYV